MKFIFLLLVLAISSGFAFTDVFADHSEVTIVPADGSGAPGCEEAADGCFIPSTATVDVGGVVIMSNTDSAAHTYTSGTAGDGPDGHFDTGLLMASGSYEWSPDTVGEYPYHCMVHPWMEGFIIVQEAEDEESETFEDSISLQANRIDNKYRITGEITSSTEKDSTLYLRVSDLDQVEYSTGWNHPIHLVVGVNTIDETLCCLPTNDEYEVTLIQLDGEFPPINNQSIPQDGEFTLPCSMQEAGDGVSAGSCHGFYSNGIARAEVGINYHSGLLSIENYQAVANFQYEDSSQSEAITVNFDVINPGESKILVFENNVSGFVSEFHMQMVGGELVVDEPEPTPEDDRSNDKITISGTIQNFDSSFASTVSIVILSPENNIVSISQEIPESNGGFSSVINLGNSIFQSEGDYVIKTQWQSVKQESSFEYEFGIGNISKSIILIGPETDSEPEPTPEPELEYDSKVTIIPTPGSGAPGCEETSSGCFIPSTSYVRPGGIVVFSNTDSAAHTFTAGTPGDGASGEFDTGLLMAAGSYEYSPDTVGEIPYLCMVHPWMEGLLIIGGEPLPKPIPAPQSDFELDFETTGMTVLKIEEDYDFISLLFDVDVSSSIGILEVVFDRDYFDSTFEGRDDEFIVLADGDEPTFTETNTNSQSRTLKIELREGTEEIEIIGSKLNGNVSNDFPDTSSQITVKSNYSSYQPGDKIKISGHIQTLAEYSQSVNVIVVGPDGNIVSIASIVPHSNGNFETTVKAGGTMRLSGDYEIRAQYGSAKITNIFYYSSGGSGNIPEPTPEPYPGYDDEITIVPADGSGAPGCEETASGCFLPEVASVSFGGKVIMKNTDSAAHTYTSGTPGDGPDGHFDTGLLMAGGTYEWTANTNGQVPYFCMVHPWMEGLILVGEGTIPPTPQPEPEDHMDLEISAEKRVYDINTIAVLNISIEDNTKSQNVAIDITDPSGTTVISRSVSLGPNDSISFEFKIDENAKTGNYKVTATTSDGNRTEKDITHFKVKSQYNSFKISSVEITDQKGNPSDLEAGEIGFIKVNMDSNKSIATLVTVNIFDSELTSIGIGSVQTTLSSGESEMILSFNIPSDAALGPADIYVNAFSDWPSEGGIPLTGEVSAVEDIQ